VADRLRTITRTEDRQSIERGTTAWLFALIVLTPSLISADSGRIIPRPAQAFRGWGMSLAWEANDIAAYSSSAKQLVLVSTNWDAVARNDLDLTAFGTLPSSAAVYRTTVEKDANLQAGSMTLSAHGHLIDELPVRSVTT
jgi:hypothetical protein